MTILQQQIVLLEANQKFLMANQLMADAAAAVLMLPILKQRPMNHQSMEQVLKQSLANIDLQIKTIQECKKSILAFEKAEE